MRTGAAAGFSGYLHEAVYYSSDEEFLSVAIPFLRGGVEAGEPTIVSFEHHLDGLLRRELGGIEGITFQPYAAVYASPAIAIRRYRELLTRLVAGGAAQIRLFGEIPPFGLGETWDWWARYEAAVNAAYDEFPLWSMCAYDLRVTPEHVLADVARTHRQSVGPGDVRSPSETYAGAVAFLSDPRPIAADPVESSVPRVDLADPLPGLARRALAPVAAEFLRQDRLDDFLVAVSEIVTNAIEHGRPSVRLRCWATPARVVATVADRGDGPTDPFAGLLPAAKAPHGGLGLWLAHQLCDHVTFGPLSDGGFVVRMTMYPG